MSLTNSINRLYYKHQQGEQNESRNNHTNTWHNRDRTGIGWKMRSLQVQRWKGRMGVYPEPHQFKLENYHNGQKMSLTFLNNRLYYLHQHNNQGKKTWILTQQLEKPKGSLLATPKVNTLKHGNTS